LDGFEEILFATKIYKKGGSYADYDGRVAVQTNNGDDIVVPLTSRGVGGLVRHCQDCQHSKRTDDHECEPCYQQRTNYWPFLADIIRRLLRTNSRS